MSEYLRKNPKAMVSIYRYECIQKRDENVALNRLLKLLGLSLSIPERLDLKFRMYDKKDGKCINGRYRMETAIQDNKNAIHYCILYEFLQNKPVGQSYKTFCDTVGKGFVNYETFKNLFERFARGKYSMDGEEKAPESVCTASNLLEERAPESSCSISIVPEEILGKIIEKLVVDDSKIVCEKIDIRFTDLFTELRIESFPVICYTQKTDGCLIEFDGKRKMMNRGRHHEHAMRDLYSIFKNPKFELGILKTTFLLGIPFLFSIPMDSTPKYRFRELRDFFKKFESLLHVKSFDIQFEVHWDDDTEPILSILPYLRPGILEKIRIKMDFDFDFSEMMQKVVKLDQWKQAAELEMPKTHFKLPLQNLTHFKRFSVFLPKISEKNVISLKETLIKSANFESCTLNYYEEGLDLQYIASKIGFEDECNGDYYYYYGPLLIKNQDTNAVFQIQLGDESINIIRR